SGNLRTVTWFAAAVAIALLLIVAATAYSFLHASRQTAETPLDPTHRQVTFTGREGAPTLSPDGRRKRRGTFPTGEGHLSVRRIERGLGRLPARVQEGIGSRRDNQKECDRHSCSKPGDGAQVAG